MTVLEQKVDALAELALARTDSEKKKAIQKLRKLLETKQEAEGTGEHCGSTRLFFQETTQCR